MNFHNLRPAVFFDRDGTINVDKNYLIDPQAFEFIPGVPEALQKLQKAGFLLVVVTNQSGVARGLFTMEDVDRLHRHMMSLLAGYHVRLDGIYVCPHHPEASIGQYAQECSCRKEQPGLLLEAADELKIDLRNSFMIGDKESDFLAGLAAGCRSFLVMTGHGQQYTTSASRHGVPVVAAFPEAADAILSFSS